MNRSQNVQKAYLARPAGISDEESDDDNGYDMSGFDKPRRNKFVATSSSQNDAGTCNAQSNGLVCEDWEASNGCMIREEYWGETPSATVHFACIRGNLNKLKEQLSANPKFKIDEFFKNTNGENPLITACTQGRLEIIEFLLTEKSANPNSKDASSKITPLIALAGCDNYDVDEETLLKCATELVKAGADINLQDRNGLTALIISVQRQRSKLVEYLLKNGANPNITETDGRSALFFAVTNGDGRMCRRLVENDADVNIEDRYGWSVPELAQDKNYPELASLLFLIRNTKWRPGCDPKLMEVCDEEALAERKARAESGTITEDSSIQFLLQSVDGEKYISNFRRHKISYVHFLTLDEEQLKEIGVDEVGVRERLLDNIQKINNAQWQESSIRSIATNKNVTAAEAVCMVVNISQHLEYISSTLEYINKRIKKNPMALQYDQERNRIADLMKFCKDAEKKTKKVEGKFFELYKNIDDLQGYTELQVVGKIPKHSFNNQKRLKSNFQWEHIENIFVGVTLVSVGLYFGLKYMKRPFN